MSHIGNADFQVFIKEINNKPIAFDDMVSQQDESSAQFLSDTIIDFFN